MLAFVREQGGTIHRDTLHSCMSVITRLCSKLEPGDESLSDCIRSLSDLLHSRDPHVSESALRCFASVADRFMRKNVDPAPLAEYGLLTHLIGCLQSYGTSPTPNVTASPAAPATVGTAPEVKTSASVSIIVGLLSTLCRGSPSVTETLLKSDLCAAIENTLQRDERCCLDTMRLMDLLLILLFEGRQALPKPSVAATVVGGCRMPNPLGGRSETDRAHNQAHRQLIDCIRSKETEALIEAVEAGKAEVNFMDDVGQTLLNWASAFGTPEMVEYLCGESEGLCVAKK